MKLVKLKKCLNEMYIRVRVGKNWSDVFTTRNGLKQGNALSPLLFNFALDYSIRRFQENHDGLKLNGTYQHLVDADDVNILGGSVNNKKKKVEALVLASKETGLEVNADKTEYMVMSRDQNARGSHSIKLITASLKGWTNSNMWEQPYQFKILFRKKLSAE
jgi:hypothetical protein